MKSAYAKLTRARRHLAEFDTSLTTYNDSGAIRVVPRNQDDPFNSHQVIVETVVRIAVDPPSEEWGLIIGDILTSLRAALDHALFGHIIARHPGLTDKEQQSIQFPVVDDIAKWSAYEKKYRDPVNPWVAQRVWDEIEGSQPMNDPLTATHHQLHVLNKLVNLDKHRAIHVVIQRGIATTDGTYKQLTEVPADAQSFADGTILWRERSLRRLPGQPFRIEKGRGGSIYSEVLEIPGYPDARWGAYDTMEELVDVTGRYLDILNAAGC